MQTFKEKSHFVFKSVKENQFSSHKELSTRHAVPDISPISRFSAKPNRRQVSGCGHACSRWKSFKRAVDFGHRETFSTLPVKPQAFLALILKGIAVDAEVKDLAVS